MMYDRFDRRIDYLRVSVTDRCNLRCVYCMPEEGVKLIPRNEILSFEEIFDVVAVAVDLGITRVRLTGGEPLVRRDVVELVRMLNRIRGIEDFAMSTNGTLLDKWARPLKEAGLHRLNISLDTLDPGKYSELTRFGDLRRVLAGISAAKTAEFSRIKLNCVVERSSGEPDAHTVARFARENGFDVQFIREMDMKAGLFWPVEGGAGGNCPVCNRLRLSCNGLIRPCLFGDTAFSVRELGPREALLRAVEAKPAAGTMGKQTVLSAIGG